MDPAVSAARVKQYGEFQRFNAELAFSGLCRGAAFAAAFGRRALYCTTSLPPVVSQPCLNILCPSGAGLARVFASTGDLFRSEDEQGAAGFAGGTARAPHKGRFSQLRCSISVGHGAALYRGSDSLFLFWRPVNARLNRIQQLCDLSRCCLFCTATEQGCTCQDITDMQNSRHFTADTTMFHMVHDFFIAIRSDYTSSVTTHTSCLQQRRLSGAPAIVKHVVSKERACEIAATLMFEADVHREAQ